MGNTCFINSILQALFFCEKFNVETSRAIERVTRVMNAIVDAFQHLRESINEAHTPRNVINSLPMKYQDGTQHDPRDCLIGIFEEFKKETLVESCFEGEYSTYSYCGNDDCVKLFKMELSNPIEFSMITIPMADSIEIENLSVQLLLNNFLGENKLESTCDTCAFNRMQTIKIYTAPNVLVINLLAYKSIVGTNPNGTRYDQKVKLFANVHLDEFIDIGASKIITNIRTTYKLKSVICHIGENVEAGHYVTLAKNNSDNLYSFDDGFVREINSFQRRSAHEMPYLLFYEKMPPSSSSLPQPTQRTIVSQPTPQAASLKYTNIYARVIYSSNNDSTLDETLHLLSQYDDAIQFVRIKSVHDTAIDKSCVSHSFILNLTFTKISQSIPPFTKIMQEFDIAYPYKIASGQCVQPIILSIYHGRIFI